MIRFREFLAGTLVSKSTVIAKNVRSFFEIIYPFESKHDRTQYLYSITRKMTVVSKAAEGIQSHLSNRASSSYRRESYRSFEEKIINHLEVTVNPSFRRENHRPFEEIAIIISKRKPIHHFETTVRHHFKTIVLSAINHPLI